MIMTIFRVLFGVIFHDFTNILVTAGKIQFGV